MTEENDRKKYDHLKGLIGGKVKTGNPIRDELIVSDATLNLADLLKKRPNIDFEGKKMLTEEEGKAIFHRGRKLRDAKESKSKKSSKIETKEE